MEQTVSQIALVEQIDAAIAAHQQWKRKLYNAINAGHSEISSATACSHDRCTFGQWLASIDALGTLRDEAAFAEIADLHGEFHRVAGSILAYVERGMASAAQFIMDGEYAALSDMLIEALNGWKADAIRQPACAPSATRRFAI